MPHPAMARGLLFKEFLLELLTLVHQTDRALLLSQVFFIASYLTWGSFCTILADLIRSERLKNSRGAIAGDVIIL